MLIISIWTDHEKCIKNDHRATHNLNK